MIKLFFDIETIPCSEENREAFTALLKKKKSRNGTIPEEEDLYKNMSFDGNLGRICCIGYIKEDGVVTKDVLKGEEKDILEKFWQLARDVDLFIGHNIFEFDLPFIFKRSIILGVKPRNELSFAKYRNSPIFDTMSEWDKWSFSNKTSLDTLAKVLGLPTSKDEMDGSMVWQTFQDGKLDEICKYCMKDVELTRQIYHRMVFEEPIEAVVSPAEDLNF